MKKKLRKLLKSHQILDMDMDMDLRPSSVTNPDRPDRHLKDKSSQHNTSTNIRWDL